MSSKILLWAGQKQLQAHPSLCSFHRMGYSLRPVPCGHYYHQCRPLPVPLLWYQVAGSHHRPYRAVGQSWLPSQTAERLLRFKIQAFLQNATSHRQSQKHTLGMSMTSMTNFICEMAHDLESLLSIIEIFLRYNWCFIIYSMISSKKTIVDGSVNRELYLVEL